MTKKATSSKSDSPRTPSVSFGNQIMPMETWVTAPVSITQRYTLWRNTSRCKTSVKCMMIRCNPYSTAAFSQDHQISQSKVLGSHIGPATTMIGAKVPAQEANIREDELMTGLRLSKRLSTSFSHLTFYFDAGPSSTKCSIWRCTSRRQNVQDDHDW